MNEQEKKDLGTIKELMNKDHDQAYIEQFRFAELAILDLIDSECAEKDKQRLAEIAERLKEPDLEPLQQKINAAIYELAFEDNYRGTVPQKAFVETRKNGLDLNRLVSRKADNKLLTNHLIVNKGMRVSKELRNSLHTKGHDDLVELIDGIQAKEHRQQNWHAQERSRAIKTKSKSQSLKM